MNAFKSLLDAECGATNPLVQLSQIYTHDVQNGGKTNDQSVTAPQTFHLPSLLADLDGSDRTANQWAKEFLKTSSSVDHPRSKSITNMNFTEISWTNYSPPSSLFIRHPNPLFLDQFDTEFDDDTVRATQNLLSFLRENQLAVQTENQTPVEAKERLQQSEELSNEINPFGAGLKCLEIQDIANAILYFQIAVRKEPTHTDAWLCLGMTQAENEQDIPAMIALKKCIELDPRNLQAHLTLASCHANEMQKIEAFHCLYQWLANNNKYSQILSNRPSSSIVYDELTFEDLKDIFFRAIALSNISNEIDADLQVCVGILFHLNDDYTKAAECFQTAILVKPNDALLWNKLGASIANGGEDEKAVHAYHRALSLSPGYIRARYNLGISCFNLRAYRQAVEHFLMALKLQLPMYMSENIWRTLANAIHHLNRSDLEQCVIYRDLRKLLHEFQIA